MKATKTLRRWQALGYDLFEEALAMGKPQIFVVAAVGSGKTYYASVCASVAYGRGDFNKIVVIAPQAEVKKQWAKTFREFGIDLNYKYNGGPLKGYAGVCMTYAGVVESMLELFQLVDERTLVIIDEIHHTTTEEGEDVNAWGQATAACANGAGFRIVLSGTPWRYTRERILYAPYVEDQDGKLFVAPDVSYSYGEAVRDKVNRPTKFVFFGGEVEFRKGAKTYTLQFSELEAEDTQRQALRAALDFSGDWLTSILDTFVKNLLQLRPVEGVVPAGLVVCKDQTDARQIRELIYERHGIDAPIVLSDMRKEGVDTSKAIHNFRTSRDRIIVSVGMISEGVDIPRLVDCLYLSNKLSSVFIWQVLGRVVRTMKPRIVEFARMYLPELPLLVDIAGKIEQDVLGVAEDKEDPKPKEEKEEDEEKEGKVRTSTLIGLSSLGKHTFTVYQGIMYSPDEMEVIRELNAQGIDSIHRDELARLIQAKTAQIGYLEPVVTIDQDRVTEEEQLRTAIKTKVGLLSNRTGASHRTIHAQANAFLSNHFKVDRLTTSKMEVIHLRKKLELLTSKLDTL